MKSVNSILWSSTVLPHAVRKYERLAATYYFRRLYAIQ